MKQRATATVYLLLLFCLSSFHQLLADDTALIKGIVQNVGDIEFSPKKNIIFFAMLGDGRS